MNCPRCGVPMIEREPDAQWMRWWECSECWAAWHWFRTARKTGQSCLMPGRVPRGARNG